MSNNFVESKFFKDDHLRSLDKMNKSIEAIKTRRRHKQQQSLLTLPSHLNIEREYIIREQNKKLYNKLEEVKNGAFSIMKGIKTDRGVVKRYHPYKEKQNYLIQMENQRLVKVIKEQKERKRIY